MSKSLIGLTESPILREAARRSAFASAIAIACLLIMTGCETPNAMLREKADRALDQGRIHDANVYAEQALMQNPADWEAHYQMGLVLLQKKQPLQAKLHLDKARHVREEYLNTPDEDTPQLRRIIDAQAEALYQLKEEPALAALLRDACRTYGQPYDYHREAKYLAKMGDVDGAIIAYRKYARFSPPDDWRPYVARADYCLSIGDIQGEIQALRQAYGIAPNHQGVIQRLRKHNIEPTPAAALPPEGQAGRL